MVLDDLSNYKRYLSLHPGFAIAFEFLKRQDLGQLPAGRNEVDGDRVYASVVKGDGRGRKACKFEAHRKYIDIQFSFSGTDDIGWKTLAQCKKVDKPYADKEDCALFTDDPDAWVSVRPGAFVIFFPEDAHAPMCGEGPLHKVVMKVPVDWRD